MSNPTVFVTRCDNYQESFPDAFRKVERLFARMQVHALITAGRDPFFKHIHKILL